MGREITIRNLSLRLMGLGLMLSTAAIAWKAYDRLGIVGLGPTPYTLDSYIIFTAWIAVATVVGGALALGKFPPRLK